jgi:hypothetical protein
MKCHRCNHLWIYTGQANSTICPKCKTTVRSSKCQVPINWDFNLESGEIATQKGQVIPYIEKWNEKFSIKLVVIAVDSTYRKVLDFEYPIISGLITQQEMTDAVGINNLSGNYNLTSEMTNKLRKLEIK